GGAGRHASHARNGVRALRRDHRVPGEGGGAFGSHAPRQGLRDRGHPPFAGHRPGSGPREPAMAVSCILCAIVAGEAEASFVHRDPLLSAFMDTHPVTPGHLLVVPNVHVTALRVLDGETTGDLLRL